MNSPRFLIKNKSHKSRINKKNNLPKIVIYVYAFLCAIKNAHPCLEYAYKRMKLNIFEKGMNTLLIELYDLNMKQKIYTHAVYLYT